MTTKHNYYRLSVFIAAMLSVLSCNDPNKVYSEPVTKTKSLSLDKLSLERFEEAESYVNISLLKAYPTHHKCDGDNRFVNLYLCRIQNTNRPLLVFEYCRKVPSYLKEGAKEQHTLMISKSDIQKIYPNKVMVDLPEDVNINPRSKFVFASLIPLEE